MRYGRCSGKINRIAPHARDYAKSLKTGLKSILLRQSNLFESLNFRYFGPVDGHDLFPPGKDTGGPEEDPRSEIIARAYQKG